jgi:RNA polymerase sigma-70 factor (sigma-E family)
MEPTVVPGSRGGAVDDEAFIAFVDARYGALVRFGVLLTGRLDSAEDLTQSALLRVYPKRRSISGAADGYVQCTMARLHWRSSRRGWRREQPVAELPEHTVQDEYLRADDRAAVGVALATLPVGQRVVLVMRYWMQLSEMEIADELGCSRETVKSRANRALLALRSNAAIGSIVGKDL